MDPVSSNGAAAARDLERAESALRRREKGDGLRFGNIRSAVGWYHEARERAQSPSGWSPRLEVSGRDLVHVAVDGGRIADPHDERATLSTIGSALRDLAKEYPQASHFFQLSVRDGTPMRKMAETAGLSGSTVSAQIHMAEAYLRGHLRGSGLLA